MPTNSLISNVQNQFDVICNDCIELLDIYSSWIFLTYGELNVLLFCIIIPYFLIGYYTALHLQRSSYKKLADISFKIMKWSEIILFIAFIASLIVPAFIHPVDGLDYFIQGM